MQRVSLFPIHTERFPKQYKLETGRHLSIQSDKPSWGRHRTRWTRTTIFARAAPKAIAAPGCSLVPTRAGVCLRMGECLIFCVNSLDCLAAGGALGFSIITRYVSEQLA